MTAVADTDLAQFLQRAWQAHAQGRAAARYTRLTNEVDRQLEALGLDGQHPAQHEIRAEQGLGELRPGVRKQLERLLDQERSAWLAAYGQHLPAEAHRDFGTFAQNWLEQCRSTHLSEERAARSFIRKGYFYDRRIPGDHLTSQFLVGSNDTVMQIDAWHSCEGVLMPQTGSALLQHVVAVAERCAESRSWVFQNGREVWAGVSPETANDFRARAVAFLGIRDRSGPDSLRAPLAEVLVNVTRTMDHGAPLRDGPQTRLVVERWDLSESAMDGDAAPAPFLDDEWWANEYAALAALAVPQRIAERIRKQQAVAEQIERRFYGPVLSLPAEGVIRGRVANVLATEHGTRAVVQAEAGLYLFGGSEQSIGQWRALQGMPVQLSRADEGGVRLELLSGHRQQRALGRDVELET